MATHEEMERELNAQSEDEFWNIAKIVLSVTMAEEHRAANRRTRATADILRVADREADKRTRLERRLGLLTNEERLVVDTARFADATEASARAAERSAVASEQSAAAALESARGAGAADRTSRLSMYAAWAAVVLMVVGLIFDRCSSS